LTAVGIQLRNHTIRRYSSRGARRYETHRHGGRWAAEARAFEYFYRRVDPKSVLDCPVGTGRWFDVYRSNGARVHGIDISQNMLTEAAKKTPADGRIRLERADVLDAGKPSPLGQGYDLIVCSRFVYWLRPLELSIMLQRFHATGSPLLLAGAKVAPENPSEERHGAGGLLQVLDRLRARFYRAVVKRVYNEDALLKIFSDNGWILKEKRQLVATRSMRYFYYFFARDDRAAGKARRSA
jgi:hypothetical protein